MNINSLNIKQCKYKINSLILKYNSKNFELNQLMINDIIIEKDYDGYEFPYFEMTITIPNSIYKEISKLETDLTAFVHMQYAYFNNDTINQNTKNPTFKDLIRGDFFVFYNSKGTNTSENFIEDYEKKSGLKYGEYGIADMCTIRILLYNKDFLFAIRKECNYIFKNTDLISSIAYIINIVKLKNIICSPPYNNKIYNQLIVPPSTIGETIDYLANTYGLHKNGTLVFMDWDIGYILDKTAKCTVWKPNEFKRTNFISYNLKDSSNNFVLGCCENMTSRENFINIEQNSIKITTPSKISDQVNGSKFISINSISGDIKTIDSKSKTINNNSTTRFVISNNIDDTTDALGNNIKEESSVINVNMQGINLNMLKPNLEYSFLFDKNIYKNIGKLYRISSYKCQLKKEGDYLIPYLYAIFKGF